MDVYYARRAFESLITAEKKRLLAEGVQAARARQQLPAQQDAEAGASAGPAKRARVEPAAPREWADEAALSAEEREALSYLRTCGQDLRYGLTSLAAPAVDTKLLEVTPTTMQQVLGHLAVRDPATLRTLMLQGLTPRAAEQLTVAFEEADRLRGGSAAADGDSGFYGVFYAALGAQRDAFLRRLLHLKELFAAQAAENVRAAVLGMPATASDGADDD